MRNFGPDLNIKQLYGDSYGFTELENRNAAQEYGGLLIFTNNKKADVKVLACGSLTYLTSEWIRPASGSDQRVDQLLPYDILKLILFNNHASK